LPRWATTSFLNDLIFISITLKYRMCNSILPLGVQTSHNFLLGRERKYFISSQINLGVEISSQRFRSQPRYTGYPSDGCLSEFSNSNFHREWDIATNKQRTQCFLLFSPFLLVDRRWKKLLMTSGRWRA